jgi:pimeloyl-ACP methyl ester carboxylesterase
LSLRSLLIAAAPAFVAAFLAGSPASAATSAATPRATSSATAPASSSSARASPAPPAAAPSPSTAPPPVAAPSPASPVPADPYADAKTVIADIGRVVAPNGVQETLELTLGGVRQVVNVRGSDRANPLLLFIHGGPGSVEMPIAWTFQRGWEDYFTVVQWDQRAAGRSYRLNDPATIGATLNPARYRDDAIELIEQLTKRYGKRKVIVLGHSWGSVVGLSVAAKRPDLLYAYVGFGQVIDFRENERRGYAWTLAEARRRGNAEAVRELEAIAPYPGDGPLDLEKTGIERKWNIEFGGLAAYREDANFYFRAPRLSPEYTPDDRKAWDAGSALTMKAMWPQLADISFASLQRVDVPVVMFVGRHDWTTPSSVTEEWLVRFEHSAHLMMIEEPGRTLVHLVQDVRPYADERAAARRTPRAAPTAPAEGTANAAAK